MKPLPPLHLSLSSSDLPDGKTKLTLTAKANTNARSVSLEIALPLGLQLLDGDERWEGPIERGKTHSIEAIVWIDSAFSYTIVGKAKVQLQTQGHFMQERKLILNDTDKAPPKTGPPIKQKGNRGSILEFRRK